jgi:superfamily II DNA or RNA helicase
MSKIIINKDGCAIEEEPDITFIRSLDDELSFHVQGAKYTKAYKGYYKNGSFVRWDGIHRILTKRLTFPYGLLDRVRDFYSDAGKSLIIEDRRTPKTPINSIDIHDNLLKIKKEPRPYQNDVLSVVKDKDCGVIRSATGSGKSLMAAMITAYFGKPTFIYVIGTDLLYQFHNFFNEVFDEDVGVIGDGLCEIKKINIVSVWTIGQAIGLKSQITTDKIGKEKSLGDSKYNDIRKLMKTVKLNIFDECHMSSCNTIQEIYKNINPEYIYGMSASPWRDDGSDLLIESIFGSKIVDISASPLIDQGYLVPPLIKFVKVPKYKEKLTKKYPHIYKKYVVENDIRNSLVSQWAKILVDKNYKVLVLYTQIAHGKILYKKISEELPCILLSGKDSIDARNKAKERLESGEVNCIIASTIFDIGVDMPALSGLILAGAGKSSVRALQRIGRVIRPWKGKKRAAVIDFYDDVHYLSKHSKERKKIYSSEKGFTVI